MDKQNGGQIRELQGSEIRKKIDQGWASLERGEAIDGEEFFKRLETEERQLVRNSH